MRRARNVFHIAPISLTNEERAVLCDHEVGVRLAGRIQLRAAKNEAVEIRVTARFVEVECGLEDVVTGSVIAGVPEGSSRTPLHMKALAQRFEGKVRPIVGILGILTAIDAHL